MPEGAWYYHDGKTHVGPHAWEGLLDLHRNGEIGRATLVWRGGTDRWVPLGDLVGEAEIVPPPLPPEAAAAVPDRGWTAAPPHPWRRWFARIVDTTVNGLAGFLLMIVPAYSFAPVSADRFIFFLEGPLGRVVDTLLTVFISLPVTAVLVGFTGASAGKLLFGIRVLGRDHRPVGFLRALGRELHMWVVGFGLGVSIVALVTMIMAYSRLQKRGSTAWDDRSGTTVLYSRWNTMKGVVAAFVIVVVLVGIALLNSDALAYRQ